MPGYLNHCLQGHSTIPSFNIRIILLRLSNPLLQAFSDFPRHEKSCRLGTRLRPLDTLSRSDLYIDIKFSILALLIFCRMAPIVQSCIRELLLTILTAYTGVTHIFTCIESLRNFKSFTIQREKKPSNWLIYNRNT